MKKLMDEIYEFFSDKNKRFEDPKLYDTQEEAERMAKELSIKQRSKGRNFARKYFKVKQMGDKYMVVVSSRP